MHIFGGSMLLEDAMSVKTRSTKRRIFTRGRSQAPRFGHPATGEAGAGNVRAPFEQNPDRRPNACPMKQALIAAAL